MPRIIEGRFYTTRAGEVVGPITWDAASKLWRRNKDFVRNSGDYWHEDGNRYGDFESDEDLIEETATSSVMEE